MNAVKRNIKDEGGSVLLIAIISLFTLTVIAIMAIVNTNIEMQIARNEREGRIGFFAAEAARGHVAGSVDLYNANNIGDPVIFPDDTKGLDDAANRISLGNDQSFNGEVEYLSRHATPKPPPRASGFSYGKFAANVYEMRVRGYGPNNAFREVEQGFFRIGPL